MSDIVDPRVQPSSSTLQDSSSQSHPVSSRRVPTIVHRVLDWMPSILTVATLAGLAWFGHRNDWKLPKFSSLTSLESNEEKAWCDSHGVSEADCIVCKPELIEESPELVYCNQHGVHGCVLCNPSLAQTKQPVAPTSADLLRAERALNLMQRKENIAISSSPGSRIQFASLDALARAGVDVEPVERRNLLESITAAGEVRYDATRMIRVSSQADGIVRDISVNVGDWVNKGDVLAVIDSQAAGQLKTELLAALSEERMHQATTDRLQSLPDGFVAVEQVLESENSLQQAILAVDRSAGSLSNLGIRFDVETLRRMPAIKAEKTVRLLGLNSVLQEAPNGATNPKNLIEIIAPMDGRVVEREATLGLVADRGVELFRVVDTRSVWLDLRVPAERASLIQESQPVRFHPDGQSAERVGNVTWISTDVDPHTRTVRVRAVLQNADEALRNESFGSGEIILREESDAIVVPESALQWDGTGHIVFVRDAHFFDSDRPKFFVTRSVRPGIRQDGFVEIIAGVLPSEIVATKGSDVLRAQLLKSNLGAGCTCGQ